MTGQQPCSQPVGSSLPRSSPGKSSDGEEKPALTVKRKMAFCSLSATAANPRCLGHRPRLPSFPSEGDKVTCRSQNTSQLQRSDIPGPAQMAAICPLTTYSQPGTGQDRRGPSICTLSASRFSIATHPSGVFHVAIATISDHFRQFVLRY